MSCNLVFFRTFKRIVYFNAGGSQMCIVNKCLGSNHPTEMVYYKKLMILKIKIKTISVVWETSILHYNQPFILQRPGYTQE